MNIFIERVNSAVQKFNRDEYLKFYSLNIINYVSDLKNLEDQELLFPFLFKVSQATNSDLEKFTDSVYLLVNSEVNFLNQKFHYYNEDYDDWEEYSEQLFSKCLISNVFVHPISGIEINQQTYFDIVQPYFIASKELLEVQSGL